MSPRDFPGSGQSQQESRGWIYQVDQGYKAPKPELSEDFKNFASVHGIPFVERPKIDTFSFDSGSTKVDFKKLKHKSPKEEI